MTDETKNEETEGLEEASQEESEESVSEESEAESSEAESSEAESSEAESDEDDSDEDDSDEGDSDEGDSDEGDSEAEASFEGDEDDFEDESDEDASDEDDRDEFDDAFDHLDESEASDEDELEDDEEDDEFEDDGDEPDWFPEPGTRTEEDASGEETSHGIDGLAAYFDGPNETLVAAAAARDAEWDSWDVFTPFPIHGIEDAMGIGRSWLPWVTFGAGGTGFLTANALQFGTLTFDWPMIIGGKPHAPWPSFVPIMFELTVLIGGVTTALVMLIAAGCFRKPKIIDPDITNDRFVLWIASDDPNFEKARAFMQELDPVEIREITFGS